MLVSRHFFLEEKQTLLQIHCISYLEEEATGPDLTETLMDGEREDDRHRGIANTGSKSCLMLRCCDKLLMWSWLNKARTHFITNLIRALQNML